MLALEGHKWVQVRVQVNGRPMVRLVCRAHAPARSVPWRELRGMGYAHGPKMVQK